MQLTHRESQGKQALEEVRKRAHEMGGACQFEAVNLFGTLLETENLSVIRGASVAFDRFSRFAHEIVGPEVVIVTRSASVVRLLASTVELAQAAGDKLVQALARDYFAPGVASARPYAKRVWDLLLRDNIAKRMATFTLEKGADVGATVDDLDLCRAADVKVHARTPRGSAKPKLHSAPTAARFHLGRFARAGLARDLLRVHDRDPEPGRLRSLEDLKAAMSAPARDELSDFKQDFESLGELSGLDGYIAVIEADGNGFGKYFAEDDPDPYTLACRSLASDLILARAWANACSPDLIRLRAAMRRWGTNADGSKTQPIHVLYSAGDDVILALPADRGFEVISALPAAWRGACAEVAGDADLPAEVRRSATAMAKLSWSAGLVIAHANTPIQHLRATASALNSTAKKRAKQDPHHPVFAVDFAVAKTHDILPEDLDHARRLLNGHTLRPMPTDTFAALLDWAKKLNANDPPSRSLKLAEMHVVAPKGPTPKPHEWSTEASAAFATHAVPREIQAACGVDPIQATVDGFPKGTRAPWPDLVEVLDVIRFGGR